MPRVQDKKMRPLIEKITIDGYRGFNDFEASGFTNVNLITGKNNTGKSTLLEAIYILLHRAEPSILTSLLIAREELSETVRSPSEPEESLEDIFIHLFNYQDVQTDDDEFTFRIGRSRELADSASNLTVRIKRPDQLELLSDQDGSESIFPRLSIEWNGGAPRIVPLTTRLLSWRSRGWRDRLNASEECIYLDSFSSQRTGHLGELWDAIALTDVEEEVVSALQLIAPEIEGVSMVGSANGRIPRHVAIVRTKGSKKPVPLRSFGDGVTRVFTLILSLVNAKDGVLLVDEIENGLHHSIQPRVWSTVFTLAKRLNVQVFATTHSQDCIRAFQRAAEDSEGEDGALIRLTRKGDRVIPTLFTEQDLKIVAADDIEVR